MQEESTLTNAQPKTQVTRVTKSDMGRLGIALFGGILVLNYYLARLFFTGAGGLILRVSDFSARARTCSAVVPQQPPKIITPAAAKSSRQAVKSVGVQE